MRLRTLTPALLLVAGGCLPATERDLQMAQSVVEMGDAINELRQATYELQDRVDSLVTVMARRDTVVRQLANLAGVPVPP